MAALLDTGFLLAVIDADDNLHAACVAALESETNPILPDVVLPELAYLLLRELGYPALIRFLRPSRLENWLKRNQHLRTSRAPRIFSRNTLTTKSISSIV